MEVALLLAHDVVRALGDLHAQKKTAGTVDAASFSVSADGHVALRGAGEGTDVLADIHGVGGVLFQLFTGLTPAQARARLSIARHDEVPPPSRLNPALDEALDELVVSMLVADPAERPFSCAYVLSDLLDVMDELGLSPDADVVAKWAGLAAAPAPAPVAVAAPAKVVPVVAAGVTAKKATPHRQPPRGWQTEDADADLEDDDGLDDAWTEPVRFDGWAMLACCFALASLAMAFTF